MLKPLHTDATFTFANGEILEEVPLYSFTPAPEAPVGRGMYKPVSMVKPIDDASGALASAMKQGHRLRSVVITVDRLQYTLTGVFIREITTRPGRIEEIQMECELSKQQHLLGVPTRW
jgi:type VI protein secretion system component Hcp